MIEIEYFEMWTDWKIAIRELWSNDDHEWFQYLNRRHEKLGVIGVSGGK